MRKWWRRACELDLKELYRHFWLNLFMKAGLKCGFEVILVYAPGSDIDEDARVKAIHFSIDEWSLKKSMREYLDEN